MATIKARLGRLVSGWGGLALLVVLLLATRTVLAEPFYVPSGSMEPTLAIGDALLTAKYPYGFSRYSVPFGLGPAMSGRLLGALPARGDVVVFRLPRDTSEVYVKRVIGLPGDRIRMQQGVLAINGVAVEEQADGTDRMETADGSFVPVLRMTETLPGGCRHAIFKMPGGGPLSDTAELVVPPGHVFMMGDNRDDSLDSRVAAADGGVGFVPLENLIGRADRLLASWDLAAEAKPLWQWPGALRWSRFLKGVS